MTTDAQPFSPEHILGIAGYGYALADSDGHDGGRCSAVDHKQEEFMQALSDLLNTKEVQAQ